MSRIFNFHQVSDVEWFQNVVEYLKSKYEFVDIHTLSDRYFNGDVFNRNSCHITVDDGHISFYNNIFPVLRKYNVPATLFVSPMICKGSTNFWFQEIEGYNEEKMLRIVCKEMGVNIDTIRQFSIESVLKTMPISRIMEVVRRYQGDYSEPGKRSQNMSVKQLKEVRDSGLVEIGAHTVNHPILKNEDDVGSREEIFGSVEDLRSLGFSVEYFAFPNGIPDLDFSAREKTTLREVGIKMAFSTEAKEIADASDAMSVPRFCISDNEKLTFLRAKIVFSSSWNQLKKFKPKGEFRERKKLYEIFNGHAA